MGWGWSGASTRADMQSFITIIRHATHLAASSAWFAILAPLTAAAASPTASGGLSRTSPEVPALRALRMPGGEGAGGASTHRAVQVQVRDLHTE